MQIKIPDLEHKDVIMWITENFAAAEAVTNALNMYERTYAKNPEFIIPKEVGAHPVGIYAYEKSELLGGITYYTHNDWIFLLCGYVWPEWRERGIYRTMIETLAEKLKVVGISGIFASTYDWEAPKVYEALGFTRGAILRNCPKGNTSIDYYKEI